MADLDRFDCSVLNETLEEIDKENVMPSKNVLPWDENITYFMKVSKTMPGRLVLESPLPQVKKSADTLTIQDEFFGVYCLISRSELPAYKNRCYVGFTVNPNRRIRQHNAGKEHGGAKKTSNKGPWDMVCIVHGFPNHVSALRFEWAWQNPTKSKRLRENHIKKKRKESNFEYHLRIACQMMNSDPWRRLALTFRWLLPEFQIPFPADVSPPPHVKYASGVVEKIDTVIPTQYNEFTTIKECALCKKRITQIKHMVRCPDHDQCGRHFHTCCLAEHALAAQQEMDAYLVPLNGQCPACSTEFLWGDLIRDQRVLLAIDASKPVEEGIKIADGMIPIRIVKK